MFLSQSVNFVHLLFTPLWPFIVMYHQLSCRDSFFSLVSLILMLQYVLISYHEVIKEIVYQGSNYCDDQNFIMPPSCSDDAVVECSQKVVREGQVVIVQIR